MIKYVSGGKDSFKGKRVSVSGSGNVAQYAALKAIELGATVISLSDSKGCIVATGEEGISPQQVHDIAQLKVERKALTEIASTESFKGKFKYIDGARPWTHVEKIDIALPCATQNEVSGEEAGALIKAGAKFIAEGSNMGCSQDAINLFEEDRKSKKSEAIWYGPGELSKLLRLFKSNNSHTPRQAKPPTPAASPSRVSRWRRTRNACIGPGRRWMTSSSRSWRTASPTGWRRRRSMSCPRRASSRVWSPAAILRASVRWRMR